MLVSVGYYRVDYDDQTWSALAEALNKSHTDIHVLNRAQVFNCGYSYFPCIWTHHIFLWSFHSNRSLMIHWIWLVQINWLMNKLWILRTTWKLKWNMCHGNRPLITLISFWLVSCLKMLIYSRWIKLFLILLTNNFFCIDWILSRSLVGVHFGAIEWSIWKIGLRTERQRHSFRRLHSE